MTMQLYRSLMIDEPAKGISDIPKPFTQRPHVYSLRVLIRCRCFAPSPAGPALLPTTGTFSRLFPTPQT